MLRHLKTVDITQRNRNSEDNKLKISTGSLEHFYPVRLITLLVAAATVGLSDELPTDYM